MWVCACVFFTTFPLVCIHFGLPQINNHENSTCSVRSTGNQSQFCDGHLHAVFGSQTFVAVFINLPNPTDNRLPVLYFRHNCILSWKKSCCCTPLYHQQHGSHWSVSVYEENDIDKLCLCVCFFFRTFSLEVEWQNANNYWEFVKVLISQYLGRRTGTEDLLQPFLLS